MVLMTRRSGSGDFAGMTLYPFKAKRVGVSRLEVVHLSEARALAAVLNVRARRAA